MKQFAFKHLETGNEVVLSADSCEQATSQLYFTRGHLNRSQWVVTHALQRVSNQVLHAANKAKAAFWEEVAACFPDVRDGDMDPPELDRFDKACERAIEAWLDANS